MKSDLGPLSRSPMRPKEESASEIQTKSESIYERANVAVKALMNFLADLHSGQQPLCVTYFDEAHELDMRFWILLRVLSHQNPETMMWYVFMGTKSSINYFTPPLGKCESSSLSRALISFKDNSAFSAARKRTAAICSAICCTRLRPERS